MRANDETQRVHQGIFVDVLREATPCLILLDELADYCVGAAAVPVGDTSLADQTISFVQQLTEAVQQVPGVVVVATLPASKYEVAQILIDALYTRWGSHPDFQRTRGVLRLLAGIVGELWKRREGNTQTQHLIQPDHIGWSIDAMQAALTRLWGPAYQAVAAADIVSERSNAGILDEERGEDYRRESIGRGLAAAILLGSFGGQGGRSGFSGKDLKLACSRYGLNWSYTDGALLELETRCFYLHTAVAGSLGKRYWFGTKPTLNKLVIQYRQQNAGKDFGEEILEDLRSESQRDRLGGATWRVIIDPAKDLPEQKSLTLLILPPSVAWNENGNGKEAIKKRILEISRRCGGKDRLYRNTLLFLAGTSRGLSKLRQAHRERALFRCFVSPAVHMNLKNLHLGVQFEMEVPEGQELNPNNPALKAMKESARQLRLTFEVEE